jgi:hypothetical protein
VALVQLGDAETGKRLCKPRLVKRKARDISKLRNITAWDHGSTAGNGRSARLCYYVILIPREAELSARPSLNRDMRKASSAAVVATRPVSPHTVIAYQFQHTMLKICIL